MNTIKLSNGVQMPCMVMSTNYMDYPLMKKVVTAGLKLGFRAFDTARDYGNEHIVGRVMQECLKEQGLKREDIFITTKIGNSQQARGVPSAEWVCDPTLLLSADSYRQLYSDKIRKLSAKYVFLYMLGNECDFDIQNVYDWAGKNSLEVVYVTGNAIVDNNKKFFATIPEWIYLIDNAEYVITNSYHCGVFSTIFGKRFGIVPLKGKDAGMNARFDSLFELRGTGDRFISDKDFSVLEKTYETKQVEVSKNFLNFLQCTNVS